MDQPGPSLFSLNGKVALVTGASRGIGRAIALGFADAGADVALLARSAEALDEVAAEVRKRGHGSLAVPCDVTNHEDVGAAVERIVDELGPIDVLVNNAGGPVFNAPFLEIRPEGWRRVVELNLLSVVWLCQAVGAHMKERGSGSVINIDTIGANHPAPQVTPYCAAKAGVVNLTLALAQEWGPAGVRVNTISPGWIRTDLNLAISKRPDASEVVIDRIPLRRWGEPEDLVGVAVWLASDASDYISGVQIPVDGGVGVVAPQTPPGPWVVPARE